MLLGNLLGGLGRLALAGFARLRVVGLADVVGLDRKSLVLHAVSLVRLGLDLAFNDDRRPGLEGDGELHQRSQNLNLEPIGILVLGAATVFPCARRSSPSGGPNQVWREAAAHQRVGRRAKTAARSRAPSRCVAPFFASSVGSSLVEIAAGVIRGDSMLLKLTISFVPPSMVGLRQDKAPAIRTDRRRRITFFLHALVA